MGERESGGRATFLKAADAGDSNRYVYIYMYNVKCVPVPTTMTSYSVGRSSSMAAAVWLAIYDCYLLYARTPLPPAAAINVRTTTVCVFSTLRDCDDVSASV